MKRINILSLFLFAVSSGGLAKEWRFDVYLDEKPIGEHRYVWTKIAEGQHEMLSQANFNVKFLFFNAYEYEHTARERWEGDCLKAIESHTQENGEVTVVEGRLEEAGFTLRSPTSRVLDDCVVGFAYWNPKMLSRPRLLNPQTGEWLDSRIRRLGKDRIVLRGQPVEADHYKLEAPKIDIDLWYSADQDWLELKSITPEGYVVHYKLQ